MRFPILRAFLCCAVFSCIAHAQEPQASKAEGAQTSTAPSQNSDSTATVYFYRYKQFVGSALSPSVYCDQSELARMDNGRFFATKLAAGEHVFHSNDKQAGIDVALKSGQDYYIRVEIAAGVMKGHGRLILVAPEQGAYEIKNLKPLDRDKIRDTEHVVAAIAAK
jgi:hypothetical protein